MQQTRNIITERADLGLRSNRSRGGGFCASLTRYSISPEVERDGLLLKKTFCGSGKHKEDTGRAFDAAVWPPLKLIDVKKGAFKLKTVTLLSKVSCSFYPKNQTLRQPKITSD